MKILSFASILSLQSPNLVKDFANDELLVISPLDDPKLSNAKFIKCEIGSLAFVLALACKDSVGGEFFDELDDGFLSGESNVDSEEIEEICGFLTDCQKCVVAPENLVGKNEKQIKAMLNLLSSEFDFELIDLDGNKIELNGELSELDDLDNFDGAIIFTHNKNNDFKGGEYFMAAAKIKNEQNCDIKTKFGSINATFELDNNIKGTVAFLGGENLKYGFETFKKQ